MHARSLRCAARVLVAALFALPAAAQSSLTARLSLHDPMTGTEIVADDGQPVRLRVALTDPATGRAPRGVELMGWVRTVADDNPSCAKAAQNFRATRRIPLGATDLNGILVSVLNEDASVSVVDPKLNLYSSNLVAAHRLGEMPASIAPDPRHMRVLLSYPDVGEIMAASLSGPDRQVIASGLADVGDITVTASGEIWAGTGSGDVLRIGPDGTMIERVSLGTGKVTLRTHPDDQNDVIAAFTRSGGVLVIDGATDRTLMRRDMPGPLQDVTVAGTSTILVLYEGVDTAEIRYFDASEAVERVALGKPFRRAMTGPDGRIAIAYTPGESIVALVDLALGRVVQSLGLNDASVSEVTFTDNAAFILSHDGGFLGAIDLATVSLGRSAILRRIDLGAQTARPEEEARLLVPFFPSPQVLAVEPRFQTGWLVGEVASTVEMPPMDSIRLRGGVPKSVHIVDRSFREMETGVFEALWAFEPGAHELVLTTYTGQLSTCIPFNVRGAVERFSLTPVRLQLQTSGVPPVAGRPHDIAFRVLDPDGDTLPVGRVSLLVPSMVSGWAGQVVAEAGQDGVLRATITLPHAGAYVVQPLDLPPPLALRSALIIEARDNME